MSTTAAQRREWTKEREAELAALSSDNQAPETVAFACAVAIEDIDSPPTERVLTAVRFLALPTNPDTTLQKLAAGFIRNQEALMKAAAINLAQWEAEQSLAADMAEAELEQ